MTLTNLEMALIAGFGGTATALITWVITSGYYTKRFDLYVKKEECRACREICKNAETEFKKDLKWVKVMVKLLCEKQGISVKDQIELRGDLEE
jgi:hypothetical protein